MEARVLRVNLSDGSTRVEVYGEEVLRHYVGGRGLAAYLMAKEVDPKVDPLSPENKLIFAPGPLSGTSAPTGGRYNVVTKSPLTGFIAFANSGGHFGAELKHAGWDLLVVEGKAEKPVYIYVNDDAVEIRDASHLWGKLSSETEEALREEVGVEKAKMAFIGPAGENLSLIAAVMNDRARAAGRCGVGAVMGSKNLKAVVVVGGKGAPRAADRERFMQAVREKVNKLRNDPVAGGGAPKYGTAVLVNIINENGLYPYRNFQESVFERAHEQSGEAMAAKYLIRNKPCFACPIGCSRVNRLFYLEDEVEGPEYETVWAFGSDLGIADLHTIILANHLCNELGFDTISAGTTLACAMELYEKGYIKREELGEEPPLLFGNTEVPIYYLPKMARREGFGARMADGSYRLASAYGHPELSMSSKKLELPAYDPRVAQGLGLQYATCNRGGDHIKGYMISPEILGYPRKFDPQDDSEAKVAMVKEFQDTTTLVDSMGMCIFTMFGLWIDDYRDLLNAFFGWNLSSEEYLRIGERIWNLERAFNLKAGLTRADDTLPRRLLEEPIPSGPHRGSVCRLDKTLPIYYRLRGWNEDGTIPDSKMEELGIGWYR